MEKRPSEPPPSAIIIGCDHAAYPLKEKIKSFLANAGYPVEDVGTFSQSSVDYPEFAMRVASQISKGLYERGILLCGTGIGMSIAANKYPRIRAALCTTPRMAAMARTHNDANVLCLGARISGPDLLEAILTGFLDASFEDGRHARRVDKIKSRETEGENR